MAKAKLHMGPDGTQYIEYWCPGCGRISLPISGEKAWGFNGNLDKPTLTPSVLSQWDSPTKHNVCHSFVTDGEVKFLNDCTHSLAGATREIPDMED